MIIIRVLILTENGRDLTEQAKIQLLNLAFLDRDTVKVVSDPLFVIPQYLRKKMEEGDNIALVRNDGEFTLLKDMGYIKKILKKNRRMSSWNAFFGRACAKK